MADQTTILQNWVFTQFVFPFLLIFFIVFAILEKSKLLGERKQINAMVAFVIGLIFVSAIYPKQVVGNLILFLTVAIIVVFVTLLIWGLAIGSTDVKIGGPFKIVGGILIGIAVIIAVLWATGSFDTVVNTFFNQSWSGTFWTNALFVIVIAAALAFMVIGKEKGS